jgi:hypothetical protein
MKTKRQYTVLALLMVFAMSCTKQDEPNNGNNNGNNGNENVTTGTLNGHVWVDLGLPSGTLWATCNVGAYNPEDYGDYFAWGETMTKTTYTWDTYKFVTGNYGQYLTKYYNSNSSIGNNNSTDNLTTLQLMDDAAAAKWGVGWHMPTENQWFEIRDKTTREWTIKNGVKGCLITGPNGNTIFLPAAGMHNENGFNNAGNYGYYWSSSLCIGEPYCAANISIHNYVLYGNAVLSPSNTGRYLGYSVRAVCSAH